MKKFSVKITGDLSIWYNHYLSNDFIRSKVNRFRALKSMYPLYCWSRKFDKPAMKWKSGSSFWWLDHKKHRVGKPARIWNDRGIEYFENGEEVK